jgi:hypothetical protein
MSHSNKPIFRVSGIAEEYAIIRRMLCPTCESQLKPERQTAIAKSDGGVKGDRIVLRCTNNACGNQIEVLFYLPEDYDPLAKWSEIKKT